MAVEHVMFMFDDLKVNFCDDRQTDWQGMLKKHGCYQKIWLQLGLLQYNKCFLHIKHTKTTLKFIDYFMKHTFESHTLKIEKFVFTIFLFN